MNRLSEESSLYLLQHQDNPVHWHAWGDAAWQEAREQQKLVVVSVGYSACHWCHVMEREVFENESAADVMNAHFVSIKVDREERPEVDALYMTAVQLMTRQGGWPLNVVCLPDGRPVWGATYLPRERWESSLMELVRLWRTDRKAVLAYAARLASGVQAVERPEDEPEDKAKWNAAIAQGLAAWRPHWDPHHGGNAGPPKFPMPFQGMWLLQQGAEARAHSIRTLLSMIRGGIHDHAGGGFARYAVDEAWRVPHFEKMLSDQGPILAWMAAAWESDELGASDRPELQQAAERLIHGVCRDFDSPSGGFFTAWDADSEGQEGRYYWWTAEECVRDLADTPEHFALAQRHFDWTPRAQFDAPGQRPFVLMRPADASGLESGVAAMLDAVWAGRHANRKRPARDEKTVVAHTAWMAVGLLRAGQVWARQDWVQRGLEACTFLSQGAVQGGVLHRIWQNGSVRLPATLEDYAAAITACTQAFLTTGNSDWAQQGAQWMREVLSTFGSDQTPLLLFSEPSGELFAERFDRFDDVLPSSNAVLAEQLHLLGCLFADTNWIARASDMVGAVAHGFTELPTSCQWAGLAQRMTQPYFEVVVVGLADEVFSTSDALRKALGPKGFVVPCFMASSDLPLTDGKWQSDLRIYICQTGACRQPLTSLEDAIGFFDALPESPRG